MTSPARSGAPSGGVEALALAVAGFALFAAGDAASKLIVVESNTVTVLWGRSLAFLLVTVLLIGPHRVVPVLRGTPVRLLLLRSVFPCLGGLCVIGASAYLPLAQVTTVLFVAPLLSMVFGYHILGERVGPWGWVAVLLGFAGVLAIMRPFGGDFSWALVIPALGGVFAAMGQVLTRLVAQRTTPRAIVLYLALLMLALSSLPLPLFWQAPSAGQWWVLALAGACQALGQFSMVAAYARAAASRIAPYSYAQLLTAALLGFALFGEVPDAMTLLGAALIVAGGLISLRLAGR